MFQIGSCLPYLLPWKPDSDDGSASRESSQEFELDTSKGIEMRAEDLSLFSLGHAQVFETFLFLVSRPFQEAQGRKIRSREVKVIDP